MFPLAENNFYFPSEKYKDIFFSPISLFLSVYQTVYANTFQLMVYLQTVQFYSPQRCGIGYLFIFSLIHD